MKIRKNEMIERLCEGCDMTSAEAKEIVEFFLDEIKKEVKKGNEVEFSGFGKFSLIHKNARMARNPRTGEISEAPAKNAVKFKAGKQFNDLVQEQ